MPRNATRTDILAGAAAVSVALAAFALYRATLLPGFDFGDTGSLQTTVGSTLIPPRVGYPLYFGIANLWLRVVGGDPAWALNLASAVEGALACGLSVLVAVELSGSIVAAVAAVSLFAVSYTFWSQAIIAEVYALHIGLVALTLLLLLRWANRPTTARLTLFFVVYAVAFGNHLSMVLLAPAYTAFLLLDAKGGGRGMIAPRVVLLAFACAAIGSLQYAWNIRALWYQAQPPAATLEALRTFWFDVTKSDWRDTMVMHVPRSMLADRAAMYWFDLRQQLGPAVPLLAVAGLARLATQDPRRAMLMATLFAANVLFAFGYNVGDAHVFYLPSHYILALLIAPGLAAAGSLTPRATLPLAVLAMAYAGSRAYRDFPALDRSRDTRPAEVISALTEGLDDQRTVFLADMNWQLANGLSYFAKVRRPAVAHAQVADLLLYAPALVRDNEAVGRDIALTERARAEIDAAYGPLLPTAPDPRVAVRPLSERVAGLPPGTPYVLCLLKPSRDMTLDRDDLAAALRILSATSVPASDLRPRQPPPSPPATSVPASNLRPRRQPPSPPATSVPEGDYAVVAGLVGRPPDLVFGANLPFAKQVQLEGIRVNVRMESWLSVDTIRRMGFGQVVAGRQHTLIVERGVSFAAFDRTGLAIRTAYAANIFSPQARYLIQTVRPATP